MKKLTLEEAKIVEGEKLYLNGETFSRPCFGPGNENLSFIFPNKFHIDQFGKILSNLGTETVPDEIKEALNLGLKSPGMMYGDYYISKNNKGCFRLKPLHLAKHILINTSYKKDPYGWYSRDPKEAEKFGAVYYRSTSVWGIVYEYFIFPMELVRKQVSEDFLKRFDDEKEKKYQQMEEEFLKYEKEKADSIKNKPLLVGRINDAIKHVEESKCNIRFEVEIREFDFYFNGMILWYTEENVGKVERRAVEDVEEAQEKEEEKNRVYPLFEKYAERFSDIKLEKYEARIGRRTFKYTEEDYNKLRTYIIYHMY